MTYLMAAILGVVQGVAEFLPISSSGHLTLLQYFFGMENTDTLLNILLHFATLISLFVVYYHDIIDMIVEFFSMLADIVHGGKRQGRPPEARRMILLIIVGTLPLFVVLLFKDRIEELGNYPPAVSLALLVTGCILFFSDRMANGRKTAKNAALSDVLIVGVAQGLATVPGLSRSGCTISAGMMRGFDRRFAVRYSFLMSMPAVLGATILEVVDVVKDGQAVPEDMLGKYLVGMVIAGIIGYFSIRLVNMLADRGKFGAFAYYCWAIGVLSLIGYFAGFWFMPQPQ